MFEILFFVHSLMRWVIALFAIMALAKAIGGWMAKKDWTSSDRSTGLIYSISMDIQVLLGLILYIGLSPLMKIVWNDPGAAMKSPELRFFFVEHLPYMLLAAAFVHIGNAAGKKDIAGPQKHKKAAIWYALSVIAIIVGMPWFRPLLPF